MALLNIGTLAPDFARRDHQDRSLSLVELRGKPVVLFFYPKDNTPICTREVCHFRDANSDFTQAGATIIGVSADSDASHQAFAARHNLPFHLLSDCDGTLRRAYKIPHNFGLLPGRITYLIDAAGIISMAICAYFSAGRHVEEALKALKNTPA
jgi:peroxiredoxin Q/BCP